VAFHVSTTSRRSASDRIGQAHDVGGLVGQHARQQLAVVPGDPLCGIALEQGGGAGQPAADLPIGNPHRQHQIAARVRIAHVHVVPR
jgi:hypothetical protein